MNAAPPRKTANAALRRRVVATAREQWQRWHDDALPVTFVLWAKEPAMAYVMRGSECTAHRAIDTHPAFSPKLQAGVWPLRQLSPTTFGTLTQEAGRALSLPFDGRVTLWSPRTAPLDISDLVLPGYQTAGHHEGVLLQSASDIAPISRNQPYDWHIVIDWPLTPDVP